MESIVSSKQIEWKTLRKTVVDLKERLVEGDILSYAWLPTERMWADLLTKEKRLLQDIEDVFERNTMDLGDSYINEVKDFGPEIRMVNIRNHRAVDSQNEV